MLAEVTVGGTTYLYPILNSGVNGAGWNVTISRPNPSNRAQNLGLDVTVPNGTQWRFYLRSMISTASHTMEYAGSGTNYTALPENGGVAIEANESVNRNGGKVWLTSTDQNGRFKVGDTFAVDQQSGAVTLDPQSVATNVVSDTSPELGGDLDVLARNIYSSVGNVVINDVLEVLSGSVSAPSLTFTGDLNTGIYRPGADQLAITTGGVQRLTVDASGRVLAGLTSANTSGAKLQTSDGLTFPATAVASADPNTLDDYEEGVFTPTIAGLTTAGTASYSGPLSGQYGFYTRIGRIVYIELGLNWASGTGTGNMIIKGLPFSPTYFSVLSISNSNITMTALNYMTAYAESSGAGSVAVLAQTPVGGGTETFVPFDASGSLRVSGIYTI
jgi:hypothetical protein